MVANELLQLVINLLMMRAVALSSSHFIIFARSISQSHISQSDISRRLTFLGVSHLVSSDN